MNGYKGFGNDFKCRGFQFEPGKTYEHDGEARACASGFHFCESPFDVWTYYPPSDSRFAKVEGMGKTDKNGEDSKVACTKLHVGAEISLNAFVNAGVKFILDRVTPEKKETNTGNQSASTNTGTQSAATNTGDRSAATVEGKESIAMATGIEGKAKGKKSCWLVLAEWEERKDGWHIKDVKSVAVDGKKIKEDTFYTLKGGKFVEVK